MDADQAVNDADDELLQAGEDLSQADEQGTDSEGEGEQEGQQQDDDGELEISIDGVTPTPEEEAEHEAAPEWVREVRKTNREQAKRIKELERQVQGAAAQTSAAVPEPGKKPTLKDLDYDEEAFERELEIWHERKARYDEAKRDAERQQAEAQKLWAAKVDRYAQRKQAVKPKLPGFDDAEAAVQDALSDQYQAMIVSGCDEPEKLVYAIGKSRTLLKELSEEKDPVRFAIRIGQLEGKLKTATRKPSTKPEGAVRSGSGTGAAVDSRLEQLRAKAERTGDYSQVHAYKMAQKKKG